MDEGAGRGAIADAIDAADDGTVDSTAPATTATGPLKFGERISIGVSTAGPYLSASIVPEFLYQSSVTLSSASPGGDEAFTIMCPVKTYATRDYSCHRGINRTLQYSDYVSLEPITGTPGVVGYAEKLLGVLGVTSTKVWVNDYGDGAGDYRTWRILDPRDTGSTAEIHPGDPVVMVNVEGFNADGYDVSLRHPGGALDVQHLNVDDWIHPSPVPTDAESRWYFGRIP